MKGENIYKFLYVLLLLMVDNLGEVSLALPDG